MKGYTPAFLKLLRKFTGVKEVRYTWATIDARTSVDVLNDLRLERRKRVKLKDINLRKRECEKKERLRERN